MDRIDHLILSITFCENKLKLIYPLLDNEDDIKKIEELYIDFPEDTEDTEDDILNMEHMKLFYKYETYTEDRLSKEVNKIINAIYNFKRALISLLS